MTTYTIDVNGQRYRLNESFRSAIERLARNEYNGNKQFDCWWTTAQRSLYDDDDVWNEKGHSRGDPILTIETAGVMVPWDRLDQLESQMNAEIIDPNDEPGDEMDDIDSGNGMKTVPPEDVSPPSKDDIFGRRHFSLTPPQFNEVPNPGGEDPNKIPPKPIEMGDEPQMVLWIPRHPDVDHTWGAGEAIAPMHSWVEWNVQRKANQPRPEQGKSNSHDAFESLCRIHNCERIGEAKPSNDIPETAGQVERKGERAYEDGRYGGGNWSV